MSTNYPRFLHLVQSALALALVAGCVSGNTPGERFHSRMRADAAEPSEYLPHHELLTQQANHFPFHYFYLKKSVSAYRYVHIADVDIAHIKKSAGWESFEKDLIARTGRDAAALCAFTHAAYEQAFRKVARDSAGGFHLEVTDRTDLPGTLIVEPAFIAVTPTKAALNYVGTVAGFFVFGARFVANVLAAGSLTMECVIRDAQTREIVAMYSDTESDPHAVFSLSNFSWTAATRINVKEIARMTAEVLTAPDYHTVEREFPIKFVSWISDADLDETPEE